MIRGRLHPLYAMKTLKYGLVLCLVPMVRALIAWNWEAFFTALQQDVLILLLLTVAGVYTWLCAGYRFDGRVLVIETGFILRRVWRYEAEDLAACEIRRSLPLRLCRAARVELFLKSRRPRKSHTLLLPARQAELLRRGLFPFRGVPFMYRPSGGEWLMLVALSTNIVTETLLVVYTVRNAQQLLGMNLSVAALTRLETLVRILNTVLPVGVSALVALVLLLTLCSLFISMLRAGGCRVGRCGGMLLRTAGLYTQVQQYIRTDCIQVIDQRHTPLSRICGYDTVFLYAGGFSSRDVPFLSFRRSQPQIARTLLPEMHLQQQTPPRFAARSPVQFLAPWGSVLALTLVFFVVSLRVLPGVSPMLGALCILLLLLLLVQWEAFFCENWQPLQHGRIWIGTCLLLSRHSITLRTQDCSARVRFSSLSIQEGRASLTVQPPTGRSIRVRGIEKRRADRWALRLGRPKRRQGPSGQAGRTSG